MDTTSNRKNLESYIIINQVKYLPFVIVINFIYSLLCSLSSVANYRCFHFSEINISNAQKFLVFLHSDGDRQSLVLQFRSSLSYFTFIYHFETVSKVNLVPYTKIVLWPNPVFRDLQIQSKQTLENNS